MTSTEKLKLKIEQMETFLKAAKAPLMDSSNETVAIDVTRICLESAEEYLPELMMTLNRCIEEAGSPR